MLLLLLDLDICNTKAGNKNKVMVYVLLTTSATIS